VTSMRLPPVPGPRDVLALVERGGDALEQLLGAVPRLVSLLDDAEELVRRVGGLVDGIETTRAAADSVVERTDATVGKADQLLVSVAPLNERLAALLDRLEPPLTRLQPTLERLAETTAPHEVDAMVELIDHLPALAHKMEVDIVPVLDSLGTVAPDLHDLLDVSRELNEMLGQIPGISRMKKRIDKQQEADGRG
jgi:ABC-type transporter Mla subunit MlaD